MAKKTAGRKPRALLEVRGITRRFGERTILDGVDLDVAAGEAVGVVGPNGSGKSTLLRCIVGADEADCGEATLDGRVLDERRPDVRRDLAVVMDDIDFYPGTALDNSTGREVLGPEAVAAPTAYSLELWFRTTSSSRSYLAGFEDDRDASYSLLGTEADRSVTMESSGRLTFGTWPGRSTSITTSRAYNDGAWHHPRRDEHRRPAHHDLRRWRARCQRYDLHTPELHRLLAGRAGQHRLVQHPGVQRRPRQRRDLPLDAVSRARRRTLGGPLGRR